MNAATNIIYFDYWSFPIQQNISMQTNFHTMGVILTIVHKRGGSSSRTYELLIQYIQNRSFTIF